MKPNYYATLHPNGLRATSSLNPVSFMHLRYRFLTILLCTLLHFPLFAQSDFVFGDMLPDAPELAPRGTYSVGVRSLTLTHADQLDVLHAKDGQTPRYNRVLPVEVWYPATIPSTQAERVMYDQVMGSSNDPKRPLIPFTFAGRALRDAEPKRDASAYPLVIVSHGYLGSRLLLTYLTENLASKGYVVVAIDHAESTFRDAAGFPSTLLNRALDDLFVLNEMAKLGEKGQKSFLSGLLDANNTGLVGYSMGGYGALNAVGAGYSAQAGKLFGQLAGGSKALETRMMGSPEYKASLDPRIKAVVAFAPWGMERGVWDAEGLAGLRTPTLFVAGSKDDISGYEKGIKAIFDGAVNADRYMLTYLNARHNVAPNPPPAESLKPGLHIDEYYRYAEPSWNERRINNINQHFVTAFLGMQLKKLDYAPYLDVPQSANDSPVWKGFKPRSSVGLEMRHVKP